MQEGISPSPGSVNPPISDVSPSLCLIFTELYLYHILAKKNMDMEILSFYSVSTSHLLGVLRIKFLGQNNFNTVYAGKVA
jgi:hypothetical protein